MKDNIYPIWKPKMMSSGDVVRKIKKKFQLDKVGHCGTLDPFAEGVLILLANSRTSDSDAFMSQKKTYIATISLGVDKDTLDSTGKTIRIDSKIKKYSKIEIENTLELFIGEILQRPPCFSAKKVNGVRLYKLARKDIFIHLKPVKVKIEKINFISYKDNRLTIEVECHRGTYIRQLGKDIAASLGTFGYLDSLSRTSIGDYCYDNSILMENV